MKKILLGLLLVVCAGCTTVYIPAYVQDVNPYKKRFYANHDRSLAATMQALNETGWEIEGRMDPAIYEKIRNTDLDEQEILLTTTVRNFPLLLGVKYGKMNIYIRSKKDISEVEIRYLAETSMFFRSFKSYKNKRIADQIFTHIERVLEK